MKPNARSIAAVFLLGGALLARSQAVKNGSFENGVDPGLNITVFAPDITTISGWTVANGSVDYCENRWQAAEGRRCIDMTGVSAGTLAQTIDGFTVGQAYRLSFLMAANTEGGPATKSLSVRIGPEFKIFAFDGTGHSAENMGWSLRTLDFTATNSTLTLSFTGMQDGLFGAALDAVSIGDLPLELSIRSSHVELCWPSFANCTYQVQFRSTATSNLWMNLLPPIRGNGSNNCIVDPIAPGAPRRFYQVIRLEK